MPAGGSRSSRHPLASRLASRREARCPRARAARDLRLAQAALRTLWHCPLDHSFLTRKASFSARSTPILSKKASSESFCRYLNNTVFYFLGCRSLFCRTVEIIDFVFLQTGQLLTRRSNKEPCELEVGPPRGGAAGRRHEGGTGDVPRRRTSRDC